MQPTGFVEHSLGTQQFSIPYRPCNPAEGSAPSSRWRTRVASDAPQSRLRRERQDIHEDLPHSCHIRIIVVPRIVVKHPMVVVLLGLSDGAGHCATQRGSASEPRKSERHGEAASTMAGKTHLGRFQAVEHPPDECARQTEPPLCKDAAPRRACACRDAARRVASSWCALVVLVAWWPEMRRRGGLIRVG